jgi:hypothetical protein
MPCGVPQRQVAGSPSAFPKCASRRYACRCESGPSRRFLKELLPEAVRQNSV